MRALCTATFLLASCGGVSQETHREVVDQLREARAQVDMERARILELERRCRAAAGTTEPEPAKEEYSQATPRDAIDTFIAAFRAERWDVIMRLPPTRVANRLTPDQIAEELGGKEREKVEAMIAAIEATEAEVQIDGDTASLTYGPGKVVELVREDGLWKIKDFD
jgi:sRNA-binding protein